MKRFFVVLCAMLLCGSVAFGEGDYDTIAQVRQNTPARWTQTYDTKWRRVEIDVPIEIPRVDSVPVLKISTGGTEVATEKLSNYGHIVDMDAYWLEAYTDKKLLRALDYAPSEGIKLSADIYGEEKPSVQPEDVALSYEDALTFCRKEMQRLWGLSATQALLYNTQVYDGVYKLRRQSGQKLWGKRVDERTGFWCFSFEQQYHGISMESCSSGNAYDDDYFLDHSSTPRITFCLWSDNDYSVTANLHQELEVVYEDIPLRSFADAKAAIEEEIMAGHLRWIGKMKLCYIPYLDPSDKTVYWLLPTWYVEGIYTGNAQKELIPVYDQEGGTLVGYEGGVNDNMVVAYEANQGKLIDRRDKSKNRRNVPEIITWKALQ